MPRPRGGPNGTYLTPEKKRNYWYQWAAKNQEHLKDYQRTPEYRAARNAGMKTWYAKTKARIYTGKICVCCGATPVELDHVAPSPLPRWDRNSQLTMRQYLGNPSNFQFLCRPCNTAKRGGHTCVRHHKYLGIWNHLPNLTDLG